MSDFNQFLHQLDQADLHKPNQENNKQHQIPPRKFPKRQYRKAGRHLWTELIIIIVLIGGGAAGANYIWGYHNEAHETAIQKPKRVHNNPSSTSSSHKLIQPTKKLQDKSSNNPSNLKDWLNKLNYSKSTVKSAMNIYQQAPRFRKHQINQKLQKIDRSLLNKKAKLQQASKVMTQFQLVRQQSQPANNGGHVNN